METNPFSSRTSPNSYGRLPRIYDNNFDNWRSVIWVFMCLQVSSNFDWVLMLTGIELDYFSIGLYKKDQAFTSLSHSLFQVWLQPEK